MSDQGEIQILIVYRSDQWGDIDSTNIQECPRGDTDSQIIRMHRSVQGEIQIVR